MKKMCCAERIAIAALALSVLWSCGDPVYLGTPYQDRYGTSGSEPEDPSVPQKRSLYVTGVEYPEDYNWQPELGGGSVEARMFLMKDGRRIVEINVGARYHVSADADMHRCIGDHLYTDYSTDDETIVKRDGVELFRYPDREMIHSMLIDGDDVYTLGSPRSGTGFTYRRNGAVVMVKGSANILSGLSRDGDHIVFTYEDVITSTGATRYRYYYVEDGEVRAIPVTDDVVRIEDARVIDGNVHYIAAFKDKSYRIHYAGGRSFELRRAGASSVSECRLVYDGGEVFVKGKASNENVFWHGAEIKACSQSTVALDWCADKENVYHLTSNHSSRTLLVFRQNMSTLVLPSQYVFIYSGCMAAYDGKYCLAAANRSKGDAPVLWTDGEANEYDFNGLFTSVSYQ